MSSARIDHHSRTVEALTFAAIVSVPVVSTPDATGPVHASGVRPAGEAGGRPTPTEVLR